MSVKHVHLVKSSPTLRALQEEKRQAWGGTKSRRARGYPHGGWDGKRFSSLVPDPGTILRRSDDGTISRFLHSPLATSSHEQSLSTSQTRFSLVFISAVVTLWHFPTFFTWPRASRVLQPPSELYATSHAYLGVTLRGQGQHIAIRLRNIASRRRLLSCTYPLISYWLLLLFREADSTPVYRSLRVMRI